jgi:3-hydroxyacyl-CoA dehydrogenase
VAIKKAAVLGAGVMGAQIAGHLAGCGVEVLLMDVVTDSSKFEVRSSKPEKVCNKLALDGIERLKKSKPAAMYDLDDLRLITPGNFEDDLAKIAMCDWVIEAVIEKLEIKQKLFGEVEKYLKPSTIISSNTSGILHKQMISGRSDRFRKNFIITHFFNPVRYMKLVELVSGQETDPKIVKETALFLVDGLGKGVVYAKDTPNFIANRIGVHAVVTAFHKTAENNWPIEVVDQVMGVPCARPKSAIFRTADIVGIDTLALVAKNSGIKLPAFVEEMVKRGWIGDKAGQGFYKRVVTDILVLDPKTMEYRQQQKIKTPSLGKARELSDPAERLRTVVLADDEAGKIAWPLVSESINYAASVADEIAHNPSEVDKAMRWGFNWELGPFEQGKALGNKFAESIKFNELTKLGGGKRAVQKKIVVGNSGADITDLGDGVFACEFHTKMNAIDGDVIAMLNQAIDLVEKEGAGLVIGNEGANFSVGANLMMIFIAASNGQWDEIDKMIRAFQGVGQRIRFCKKPVVAAPFGMTLGGGAEITMSANHINAAAETYMGLVEVGVGLIPAGGGCKNVLLRMEARHKAEFNPKNKIWMAPYDGGPFPKARDSFQTIAFAKVSTSAKDAVKIGYLKSSDNITLDREKMIMNAKKEVLDIAKSYQPPVPREDISLPGNGGKMAIVNSVRQTRLKGGISDHDAVIGEKLAHILTGGDKSAVHKTTEQHILDLEREVFMSLCGMEKTVARIQHMLSTGKPLRN